MERREPGESGRRREDGEWLHGPLKGFGLS